LIYAIYLCLFFFQAEDGIRAFHVTGVQTCALPISPPAAPPFMPNEGPREGSRRHTAAFLPIRLRPSVSPTEVVVLPSPAGVGLIAVTRISLPSGRSCCWLIQSIATLALVRP